ncbi:hypothetical protein Tco_0832759 [Tanacetum coccineum]
MNVQHRRHNKSESTFGEVESSSMSEERVDFRSRKKITIPPTKGSEERRARSRGALENKSGHCNKARRALHCDHIGRRTEKIQSENTPPSFSMTSIRFCRHFILNYEEYLEV